MKFKKVNEGISFNGKTFDVRFFNSSDEDIIDIVIPFVHESTFDNNVYYFGYKFNKDVPSKIRSKFIHWIKGLEDDKPDVDTVENLVALPLVELNKEVNLSTFSCTLYPRSNRSDLTRIIQRSAINVIPRMNIHSFELIKTLPQNIEFDWYQFDNDYTGELGDYQYRQIKEYVNNILLPKIHSLDYFSIAQNVKYKYRPYIKNYLSFENKEQEDAFKALNGGNILILDDINTSGSTLREILKIIRVLVPESKIYIFTLIGNKGEDE